MEIEIVSREDAKKRNLKLFFTGVACVNGHTSPRTVSNSRCVECTKAHARAKYEKNKEEILSKAKEYRDANKGRIQEYLKGYRDKNKDKANTYAAEYRQKNKEAFKQWYREYYKQNKESILERGRQRYRDSPEKYAEYQRKNADKIRLATAKRRSAMKNAIPKWLGELDLLVLGEAYSLATEREIETGIKWHVDHMIPISANKACGLHCAANIQVIPAVMNIGKNNRMVLTEPLAWLK